MNTLKNQCNKCKENGLIACCNIEDEECGNNPINIAWKKQMQDLAEYEGIALSISNKINI